MPDSSSDEEGLIKERERLPPPLKGLMSESEVDTGMFNVFVAVPGQEDDQEDKIRFTEHVYTISEEDLASTDSSLEALEKQEDKANSERTQIRNMGRRQFRKCQSTCVQSSCLPVTDVTIYTQCVSNCKTSCSE